MSIRSYIIACALLNVAPITAVSAVQSTENPLLKESMLPFHFPPFDKIKNGDFKPAIEAGMREQLKEIETIAGNTEKPTFENTIVAMEKTGRLLDRAERTFDNLNACNTNPEMQKIDKEMAPKLSAHRDAIHLNGKLFARIQDALRPARSTGARCRIGIFARALLKGFRARRREALRRRTRKN